MPTVNPDGSIPSGGNEAMSQTMKEQNGMMGDVGNALLSSIPVLGSAFTSLLSRGQAKRDVAAQNEYNLPINQKKRLADADIPMAAMFSGGFGNESATTRPTQVDPSLGTAKGVESFLTNRMNKMQMQVMQNEMRLQNQKLRFGEEEIRDKAAIADRNRALADRESGRTSFDLGYDPSNPGQTNQVTLLRSQQNYQLARQFIAENDAAIRGMENEIMYTLKDVGVQVNMAKGQLSLLGQNLTNAQADEVIKNQQVRNMIVDLSHTLLTNDLLAQQFTAKELEAMINDEFRRGLIEGDFNGFKAAVLKLFMKQ